MGIVEWLAQACGPWQALYNNSVALSTTVTTVHVLALVVGGGLAIAADRATLRAHGRAEAERSLHLIEMGAIHRPVLSALFVLFVSGVLLFAADVETYATSWVFWVKMGLIVALLANGLVLRGAERRLEAHPDAGRHAVLWHRLRVASVVSLTLWLATAVAGQVLVNAA